MANEMQLKEKNQIAIGTYQGSRSVLLNSLSEIHSFAGMVTKTNLVPKNYRGKPEDATVAIIYGMEIGLPPMSSLQNISIVDGSPAVWGDAQLSLVQSSGKYEYHKSSFEGEGDKLKAIFEVKRIGAKEPIIKEFTVDDAKKANLWNKAGAWTTHPKVMLSYKARAFALREAFADILKGMHSAEEMEGESIVDVTPKSKTAAAHAPIPETPPAEIEEVFQNSDDVSGLIQTDFLNEKKELSEDLDKLFKDVSEYIKAAGFKNEKALEAFKKVTHAEVLDKLKKQPDLFGKINDLLINEKKRIVDGK